MLPYLLRRFFYMAILLALMSVVAFAIIQLPPGDFLSSYAAQLEAQGRHVDEAVLASLKRHYGLDLPLYRQYLKWMGKMIAGDFGLSFAWQRPVAELPAERLPITIALALITLTFTYVVAILIGIYSATHQYSAGDFIFTAMGFAGLAVPNFLFALILMFLFFKYFNLSVGGLFSPDFIEQGWSFGKVLDLITHLPIPIIVIGTAGAARSKAAGEAEDRLYIASQWKLMWYKFRKHKLALVGVLILGTLYGLALCCELFSTYDIQLTFEDYANCPPQRIHFLDEEGVFHLRPFLYALELAIDPDSLRKIYTERRDQRYPLYFFTGQKPYKLWGLFSVRRRLVGVRGGGTIFLFGTDRLGRDFYSRTLHAARVSLSLGLVGMALSFVLGITLGGISGYFGGSADTVIQRIIEFLISIPTIPLWMALPPYWSVVKVYFSITVILSFFAWTGLARVVRGKLLELREEDFVMAAKISGAGEGVIIMRHLLPSFLSYLIVNLTLSVPYMIIGETSLSFLGIGLRAPAVSWGVLMHDAQNVRTVALHPWMLIPGLFVIVTVPAFNFVGDGLRDAADPYR